MTIQQDGVLRIQTPMLLPSQSVVTIDSGGSVTLVQGHSIIAANTGTADDLDTINLDENGSYNPLFFILADTGHTITLRDGIGNIECPGAVNVAITEDTPAWCLYDDTTDTVYVLPATGGGGGTMNDFALAADSGTPETVSDGETVTIAGGTGIDTSVAATNAVTVAIDSTVATLTGAQVLTNKDLTDVSNTFAVLASEIVSGTLLHERGGLEADVSAYDGVPLISGGATSQIKYNLVATAAPTVNDDSSAGYAIGSRWVDVTNDKEYVALDVTVGAAVWKETTASGSGAPTGAQYLALATDAGLSAERVFTPGDGLSASDAGANGAYTLTNAAIARLYQTIKLRWLANDKILVSGGSVAHGNSILQKTSATVLVMGTAGDWIDGASGEAASSFAHVYINSSGTLKLHDTMPNNSSVVAATYVANMRVNQAGWNGTAGSGLNATSVIYDTDTGEGSIAAGMLLGVYSDSAYTLGRGKGSAAAASLNDMSFALITAVDTGTNTLTLEAGHQIAMFDNDYLIVIENAPVVYRDESGTVWRWLGAMFNNSGSNLDASRQDYRATYALNEGADLTTSGTSFADVNSSFVHVTICPAMHDIQVSHASKTGLTTGDHVFFDVALDGTDYFTNDGLAGVFNADVASTHALIAFSEPLTNLLPGTHTTKLRWKVAGGSATATMSAGAGSANFDTHGRFTAQVNS